MPRSLDFVHGKDSFAAELNTINRQNLYGSVRVLTRTADDEPCTVATLAVDGKTLIPKGGTALGYVNPEGHWLARDELTPVDLAGEPLTEVPSTFSAPVTLKATASVEEFLNHSTRLSYLLSAADDAAFPKGFLKALKSGTIFRFGFSYRGGVGEDPAFILSDAEDRIWLLITTPNQVEYVNLSQAAVCHRSEEPDGIDGEDDDDDDNLDFGML